MMHLFACASATLRACGAGVLTYDSKVNLGILGGTGYGKTVLGDLTRCLRFPFGLQGVIGIAFPSHICTFPCNSLCSE